ncbi:RNA polymerase sigma-70 factor [Paenibacillus phyllosphaerae]|uniref:RNA polymerase sigma-70 factor n=1 Tax=Paenibacillus phyllosphaerae TaxID=274593 RepID=UPI00160B1B9C
MQTEQLYVEYRSLLVGLAYRMLGSASDAEDIVQDAFIALAELSGEQVRNMKAYLCKMVSNRCIDRLRSARHKRELYVGPWLPEPVMTDQTSSGLNDPQDRYVFKESLSTAYLLLLQQLSWTERAVFLLREVMQFEYDEIADIVGKSSTNCRQIFRRAKRSIGEMPIATGVVQARTTELVQRFTSALASGSIPQLLEVLADDAVLQSDGGGKVRAAVNPINGADRISRFFFGILSKADASYSFELREFNGLTGIVTYTGGQVHGVLTFRAEEERITNLYYVVNPEKLAHLVELSKPTQ